MPSSTFDSARKALVGGLALVVALTDAATSWASPADLFGAGAASIGRAGTGVSSASGSSAARLNPALLAGGGEASLRLGYRAADFDLRGSTENQSFDLGDGSAAMAFGARLPLSLAQPLEDRLGLGIDFNTPGAGIARVRILSPEKPQFPLLATRAEALDLSVGLGVLLPLSLRLGAGVMAQASVAGTVELQAGGSSAVRSHVDDELYVVTAPIIGAAWVGDAVAVGLVYRGELRSEFDLRVTLEDLGRLALPPLNVTGLAQYDPEQVHAEVSFDAFDYEFSVGVGYKLWSKIEALKGATVICPSDAEECEQPDEPVLGFEDTWVPRFSVSRGLPLTHAARLDLSLGYFYEPSPLPAQRSATNLWDNPRHALSLGSRLQSGIGFDVVLGLQRHFLVERRHEKTDDAGSPMSMVETSGSIWVSSLDVEVPF